MEVRRSTIHGAGWGVFATKPYRRHQVVAVFGGVRGRSDPTYTMQCGSVTRSAADPNGRLRWADGTVSAPMQSLTPPTRGDSRVGVAYMAGDNQSTMTRFINHKRPGGNLRIGPRFRLIARRAIAAGEELSFNYGASYWGPTKTPS